MRRAQVLLDRVIDARTSTLDLARRGVRLSRPETVVLVRSASRAYAYLMTRRIERAKALLRQGMSVTDTCIAVGATSLGSFSSRFTEIVGEPPSQYRARDHRNLEVLPSCVLKFATRTRRTKATI
jgi:methylphosphotriester-DNA--protein-cysteine methyltransferase